MQRTKPILLLLGLLIVLVAAVVLLTETAEAQEKDGALVLIDFDPARDEPWYSGDTIRIEVMVRNNGTDRLEEGIQIYFNRSDDVNPQMRPIADPVDTGPMEAGQEIYEWIDWRLDRATNNGDDYFTRQEGARTYNISVEIWAREEDPVSDPGVEDNNQLYRSKIILPVTPDVRVDADDPLFEWGDRESDSNATINTYIDINTRVRTDFDDTDIGDVEVNIRFNDEDGGSRLLGTIVPSALDWDEPNWDKMVLEWLTPSGVINGTLLIYAQVDQDYDRNMSNNEISIPINITDFGEDDKYDFDISAITIDSGESGMIFEGTPIRIRASVSNIGYRANLGDPVDVTVSVEGEKVGDTQKLSLYARDFVSPETPNIEVEYLVDLEPDTGYQIRIQVDPDDDFDEDDEDNNEQTKSFNVKQPSPRHHPDLFIKEVLLINASGGQMIYPINSWYQNSPVYMQIVIMNRGNMSAKDVPLRIQVDNGTDDEATLPMTYFTILGGKYDEDEDDDWREEMKTVLYSWQIPNWITEGDHEFNFIIDPYNNTDGLDETDELKDPRRKNNYKNVTWKMTAVDLPDPTVTDIWFTFVKNGSEPTGNRIAIQHGEVDVNVKVKNVGEATEIDLVLVDEFKGNKSKYSDEYAPDGTPVGDFERTRFIKQETIGKGQSRTFTFSWYEWQRRGEESHGVNPHTFNATIVSVYDSYGDCNWSNNTLTKDVFVTNQGEPDLDITAMSVSPDVVTKDQTPVITVKVKNIGTKATEGGTESPTEVYLLAKRKTGNTTGFIYIDKMDTIYDSLPGEMETPRTLTYNWDWTGWAGAAYTLKAVVDPNDLILEENENNNEETVGFTIDISEPDFKVDYTDVDYGDKLWNDQYLIMGTENSITLKVHNLGNEDVTQDIEVEVSISSDEPSTGLDLETNELITGGIPAYGSKNIIIDWTPAESGYFMNNYTFAARVVPETEGGTNPYNETDIGNNHFTDPFMTIARWPDLKIEDANISHSLTYIEADLPVTFEAIVWNVGPGNATNFFVDFEIPGQTTKSEKITKLDTGQFTTIQYEYTPRTVGEKVLTVRVDPDDDVDDLIGGNQVASHTFFVVQIQGVEVELTELTVPTSGKTGKNLKISAYVSNLGDQTADGTKVILRIDGVSQAEQDIDIRRGQGQLVEFNWKPKKVGENYLIEVEVDHPDDKNQDNNIANANVTIAQGGGGPDDSVDPVIFIVVAAVIGIVSAGVIFFLLKKKA